MPGPSYLTQILDAMGQSRAVVLVLSADAMSSWQVGKEIEYAHEAGMPFIPLLVGISHASHASLRRSPRTMNT